jgi:CheY-like chemotaxis protein
MPTILLVDDEPTIVRALTTFMRRELPAGWGIAAFVDALPAIAFVDEDILRDIVFAIVDLTMPGLGGADFIAQTLEKRPDLRRRIAVFSGSVLLRGDDPLFTELGCLRLNKPFEIAQLHGLVRSVTGG